MSDPSRPVSGFVPLGDVAGAVELPGGRVLTRRAAAGQARHHFTQLDQVTQLIGASETDADLGFMARLLALCSLPRTNPGDRLQYVRCNGPYTLTMTASTEGVKLPYGNIPRLLLAWVCTEAVRTQSARASPRPIRSRSSCGETRDLGAPAAADTGGRTRLRNQMRRLFGCTVSLIYEDARRGSHA